MADTDHARFMRLALELAEEAGRQGDVPVGAVLVRDGQVIASACNRRERDHDPLGHAEMLPSQSTELTFTPARQKNG